MYPKTSQETLKTCQDAPDTIKCAHCFSLLSLASLCFPLLALVCLPRRRAERAPLDLLSLYFFALPLVSLAFAYVPSLSRAFSCSASTFSWHLFWLVSLAFPHSPLLSLAFSSLLSLSLHLFVKKLVMTCSPFIGDDMFHIYSERVQWSNGEPVIIKMSPDLFGTCHHLIFFQTHPEHVITSFAGLCWPWLAFAKFCWA